MSQSRKWLLLWLVLSVIYLIAGLIFYTSEVSFLDGHPIFAAIYLSLIAAHAIIYGTGLLFSWIGFFLYRKGMITFGVILKIISGIAFFPSLLIIIPLSILLLIFNRQYRKENLS